MQSVLYVHQNYGITPATDPLLLFSFKSFFFSPQSDSTCAGDEIFRVGPVGAPFSSLFHSLAQSPNSPFNSNVGVKENKF